MKKIALYFLLVGGFAGLTVSCNNEELEQGNVDDLSVEAKSFLFLRSGTTAAMNEGRNTAINMSFQEFFNSGGRKGGRLFGDSTTNPNDTTIISNPSDPNACSQFSYSENPDGSIISSVDYGEGCDLGTDGFIYIMYGRFTQMYKFTFSQNGSEVVNGYEMNTAYDNYGAYYSVDSLGEHNWSMDGSSAYVGSSTWDSLNSKFEGAYDYADDMSYQSDTASYAYVAEGSSTYDDKKWTLTMNTYRYTEGDNFYESKVLQPLVYKYSCTELVALSRGGLSAAYVSGREQIRYKQGDRTGSFVIDYGDGTCDNIITIIEDGLEIRIDLTGEWEELNAGG
jgi:hypothetical protein